MKKSLYFLAAFAALAACTKSEVAPETFVGTPVSTLTVSSGPVTKTATDGSLQVIWSAGDQIAVYGNKLEASELATPFTISGSGGAATATFTGTTVDCADYGIAVYPYVREDQNSDNKYRTLSKAGVAGTWILRQQHHVANSIPNESLVMASRFDPKDGKMTFKPLAAVLEVKLYGEVSIKKIRVEEFETEKATSMGGKNLSGRMNITFDESGIPTAEATESSYVDYICDTPVALGTTEANATSFFIVVSGTASFHHLNLIITDGDNKDRIIKVGGSGETTTLSPGKVYSLPAKKVEPVKAQILAKWILDADYKMGEFHITDASSIAESGNALPSSGSGFIKFKNNDYNADASVTGVPTTFRTNITGTPSNPSYHLCFIPVTASDEILIAATGCSLASGDKVQLLGCLYAYASNKNLTKVSTCGAYELDYSLDGTTWTKIRDISLTANTNANPVGNTTAATDLKDTVTLTAASSQILFRILATSNQGSVSGVAITETGQTRLCYGSESQMAILQLP